MELASGYNQVSVKEADRPKTAFCTPFGLFEGIECSLAYLDDIVVFSSTVEQHLERLEVVLGRLQQEGLKAKLANCAFFQKEVCYLGHVISDQGVSTDPSKVEVVANWQAPTTISGLRSFLGFSDHLEVYTFLNMSVDLASASSSAMRALQWIMSQILLSVCPSLRARLGVPYCCFSSSKLATFFTVCTTLWKLAGLTASSMFLIENSVRRHNNKQPTSLSFCIDST